MAAVALLAVVVTAAASGGGPATDGTVQGGIDTSSAIVELKGDPLSTYAKTKPAPGKKIDFSSNAVKSYRAQLAALRNDFKQWLKANAPAAKVTGEFDVSLNAVAVQLNGTPLSTIASAPLVQRAEYEGIYRPLADPDLGLIGIPAAWGGGGGANAGVRPDGSRVKIAIIDTGIDITSPCFDDTGYAPAQRKGVLSLTNNKVIVAKVFNNKTPSLHWTPVDQFGHGTHVAGTAACDYGLTHGTTSVDGVNVTYGVTGVAPGALLGNYNVFPGTAGSGRSEDILNALDAAAEDGFDVANMSLGGGSHGIQDLLSEAVDDLDQAGMVVAVAAGNSGPGFFTVESPGLAPRALTAGASTAPHFIGAPVTVTGFGTFGAASGSFATVSSDLTSPLGPVLSGTSLSTACSALPAGSLTGKIALISRGVCTFSTKIRNAQGAGAVAVLVRNNVAGDPIAMGQDGTPSQPTVPAYMVSRSDGDAVKGSGGASTTIGATKQYFQTTNADIMAGFSSRGPTDVDFRVKPDVVAPGVNVLSSVPTAGSVLSPACAVPPCWAFFQGTSMATPHLAGSAAVVLGQHPTWSPAEVRSAIVNTADAGVLKNFSTGAPETNVNVIGAGRENLNAAVHASVALDPVSISFGAVPFGSGQTKTFEVTLTNLRASATTYTAAVGAGDSSVGYSVSPTAVLLAGGASRTITVTMSAVKGAVGLFHQATLTISDPGGPVAHAAVFTLIK